MPSNSQTINPRAIAPAIYNNDLPVLNLFTSFLFDVYNMISIFSYCF